MKSFSVHSLKAGYGKTEVLHGVDIDIPINQTTAIVGANGCGKTTLLKCMANIIKPFDGVCLLDDIALKKIKPRELARRIAYCAQEHPDCGFMTVRELVSMGRYPYGNEPKSVTDKAVDEAMTLAGVFDCANFRLGELSSGYSHRAWLALALARQPELLLLDEPTNFLDPLKKQQFADILQYLKREKMVTVVMVTHDLQFVSQTADKVIAVKEGRAVETGTVSEVMNNAFIEEIYA